MRKVAELLGLALIGLIPTACNAGAGDETNYPGYGPFELRQELSVEQLAAAGGEWVWESPEGERIPYGEIDDPRAVRPFLKLEAVLPTGLGGADGPEYAAELFVMNGRVMALRLTSQLAGDEAGIEQNMALYDEWRALLAADYDAGIWSEERVFPNPPDEREVVDTLRLEDNDGDELTVEFRQDYRGKLIRSGLIVTITARQFDSQRAAAFGAES